MASLRKLSLRNNLITVVPSEISSLGALQELDLSHNKIAELPASISLMASLRSCFVNDNHIEAVFSFPQSLTELNIRNNKLAGLVPECITSLKQLNMLNITGNHISGINGAQFSSTLAVLEGSFCLFAEIPLTIFSFSALQVLSLSCSEITSLPSSIGSLTSLKNLNLGMNKLSTLPLEMGKLSGLIELCLSFNNFEKIPDCLLTLKSLTTLSLAANFLSETKGLESLTNLEKLDLGFNKLGNSFMDGIATCTKVRFLDVSHNCISVIPQSLSKFGLEDFVISGNLVEILPEFLFSIKSITGVKAEHNKIAVKRPYPPHFRIHGNPAHPLFIPPSSSPSPLDISFSFSEMIGRRCDNQDSMVILSPFLKPSVHLAALFDGHSGKSTSDYAAFRFPDILAKELESVALPREALYTSVHFLQHELESCRVEDGATFIAVLIWENKVIVAHSGDSRAVLCRGGKAFPLTRDHKPQVRSESQRIIERGGFVRNGRVNGELALSRAIGDTDFQPIVTCEPEVSEYDLRKEDDFIIIGCDGVWDVLGNQQAVDTAKSASSLKEAAIMVKEMAYHLGSQDNISVEILQLKIVSIHFKLQNFNRDVVL
eukprot:TRINITY_DN9121_c0_g1_i1.p1 TRINITY_DN9121_c0_g1~~TRINITY_DN9121_c0_g1_i1.p1  ORF type:complete len:680 (+),score=199.24 TRINITY_DN9121_c0_g1_i1:241-2040(+)